MAESRVWLRSTSVGGTSSRRSSVPQPTKVSQDGGHADRSGARVPRCTPTSLSHAAEVCRPSEEDCDRRPVMTASELSLGRSRMRSWMIFMVGESSPCAERSGAGLPRGCSRSMLLLLR